jgi:Spy/CpxP family protein refolding chaperone
MKRNRILLIATALILTFAVGAMAQPSGRMGGQGNRGAGQQQGAAQFGGPQWIARYLGLTEAQIAQFKVFQDEAHAQIVPILATRKANMEKLQELLAVTTPDPLAVGTLVIQNHALGAQIRAIHEATQAKLVGILTPEQKAKYDTMIEFLKTLPGRGPGFGGQGFGAGQGSGYGYGNGNGGGSCPWCED